MGRSTLNCGLLILRGTALAKLGQDALASTESAGALAYQIAFSRHWPDSLDGLPLLKRALSAEPLKLSRMLFSTADPSAPLAPLARKLVDGLDPGVERRTLDLIERSRAGHAVPEDAETLAAIIVEAPQLRLRRAGRFPSESSRRVTGWPAMPPFPTEQVIWNLSGEIWADYYRASCRFSPLVSARNIGGFYGETAHPAGWSQWRPDWPTAREADLMIWAWQQLRIMNEATEERAAGIARRIAGPTDRFLFAARCGRKKLLAAWSQDRALLGLVSSDALMQAVYALQRAPGQAREEAAIVIAGEMARRLDVNGLDLIRSMAVFAQHAPPGMIQEMQARALNPVLMKSLGTNSDPADQAMRDHWQSNLVRTIPHPLHGLPVCPSVERFRVLAGLLKLPLDNTRSFQGTSLQMVADEFFGGEAFFDGGARSPELLRAVASFPTAHPLKWQIDRWDTLRRAYKLGGESLEGRLTGSDRGTEDQQNAGLVLALREFAEEEQSQLSWHLVRAMLEPKPTKRALLLDLVKTRSPLSTGLAEFDPVASPQGRAAGKPAPVLADPQKPFPVSPPP